MVTKKLDHIPEEGTVRNILSAVFALGLVCLMGLNIKVEEPEALPQRPQSYVQHEKVVKVWDVNDHGGPNPLQTVDDPNPLRFTPTPVLSPTVLASATPTASATPARERKVNPAEYASELVKNN